MGDQGQVGRAPVQPPQHLQSRLEQQEARDGCEAQHRLACTHDLGHVLARDLAHQRQQQDEDARRVDDLRSSEEGRVPGCQSVR